MSFTFGLFYVIFLMLLGVASRITFSELTHNKNKIVVNFEFCIHSFFQGMLCLIVLLNAFQLLAVTNNTVATLIVFTLLLSIAIVLKSILSSQFTMSEFNRSEFFFFSVVLASSLLIYINGALLPNIAWDSWSVWEGRANQWMAHGLGVKVALPQAWLYSDDSIFNLSANYPEGLSLLYFVPKLFTQSSFEITQILYFSAYAFTVLVLQNHIKEFGASYFLQLFFILLAFTLPLMGNHLMISGYADIWIAIILVLVLLTYIDYANYKKKAALITLLGYVCLLPMFKLEGWIWLTLLVLAHSVSVIKANKKAKFMLLGIVLLLIFLVWLGIDFETPFGPLILSSSQVNIFSLLKLQIEFTNISELLMSGLFWQNNWSLIWLGLPFLFISFFTQKQDSTSNTIHLFFTLSILSVLFLFYFTKASQWAEDFTAINRIVLQLTPCYLLLLFRMLTQFELSHNKKHQ